jgi:hypothetical protein
MPRGRNRANGRASGSRQASAIPGTFRIRASGLRGTFQVLGRRLCGFLVAKPRRASARLSPALPYPSCRRSGGTGHPQGQSHHRSESRGLRAEGASGHFSAGARGTIRAMLAVSCTQSQILVLRTVTSPSAPICFVTTTRQSSTGAGMPTTLTWYTGGSTTRCAETIGTFRGGTKAGPS